MSDDRRHGTVQEKEIDKNKFNNKRKLNVVFDRAMSNVYINIIFSPTISCVVIEIYAKNSQHCDNGFDFKIIIFENIEKMFINHIQMYKS